MRVSVIGVGAGDSYISAEYDNPGVLPDEEDRVLIDFLETLLQGERGWKQITVTRRSAL